MLSQFATHFARVDHFRDRLHLARPWRCVIGRLVPCSRGYGKITMGFMGVPPFPGVAIPAHTCQNTNGLVDRSHLN